jgi:hypothetical protein
MLRGPMGGEANLVALYRCKQCGVRLYEKDTHGHLERHGVHANGNWREFFTRGRKDTFDKPGGSYAPMYKKSKKKRVDKSLN